MRWLSAVSLFLTTSAESCLREQEYRDRKALEDEPAERDPTEAVLTIQRLCVVMLFVCRWTSPVVFALSLSSL